MELINFETYLVKTTRRLMLKNVLAVAIEATVHDKPVAASQRRAAVHRLIAAAEDDCVGPVHVTIALERRVQKMIDTISEKVNLNIRVRLEISKRANAGRSRDTKTWKASSHVINVPLVHFPTKQLSAIVHGVALPMAKNTKTNV